MKLNLGCGTSQMEDYINLDRNDYSQEVIRDVSRGLPFDDNKFDEVYSSHFMEHIPTGEELFFVLSEIWRVCKNDGMFIFRVPHSDVPEAFFPDHLSYWNESVVNAICNDPYQRDHKAAYKFEVTKIERVGIELQTSLKIIK